MMGAAKKKMIPIGIENFEEIREEGFYYVDKTGFIIELLSGWQIFEKIDQHSGYVCEKADERKL